MDESTALQKASFLAASGISMPNLNILIASIFISLILIFAMVILRASHKAWDKEYIDSGQYFTRYIGVGIIVIISIYLIN